MKIKITMDNGDEYWIVTGNETFDIGHWLSDEISKEKYVELPTINPGSNGPVKIWLKSKHIYKIEQYADREEQDND